MLYFEGQADHNGYRRVELEPTDQAPTFAHNSLQNKLIRTEKAGTPTTPITSTNTKIITTTTIIPGIHNEISHQILAQLPFFTKLRCRFVCSAWRKALRFITVRTMHLTFADFYECNVEIALDGVLARGEFSLDTLMQRVHAVQHLILVSAVVISDYKPQYFEWMKMHQFSAITFVDCCADEVRFLLAQCKKDGIQHVEARGEAYGQERSIAGRIKKQLPHLHLQWIDKPESHFRRGVYLAFINKKAV